MSFIMLSRGILAGVLVLTAAASLAAPHWPQFRGPEARGVTENPALPDTWSATENVAWKTDIPGRGWSSPVVWGDRVFLTTVINLGESEAPRKGLYFGGDRSDPAASVHQWKVYALDLVSGTIVWDRLVHEGTPQTPIHIKNSYASETPVTDGERLYAYFGQVGIFCFDFEGALLWEKAMPPQETRYNWGTAASPALHEDTLYIVNDNQEASYLLALDAKTGEERWRVPREENSNWATPYIWKHDLRTEIVTPGTDKVRSYDLAGNLLWSFEGMSVITIATPYAANGLLYISSGYVLDKKQKPIYAIRPGASGDISLAEGETGNEFIAWYRKEAGPYNPSTLVYKDRLYVLYDRGQVSCYNALTGDAVYERERIRKSRAFTASPWAYNGKIFCLNEYGTTYVFRAGDSFELLHQNTLAEDDMGMATPAIAGDRLLLRSGARIYCLQQDTP